MRTWLLGAACAGAIAFAPPAAAQSNVGGGGAGGGNGRSGAASWSINTYMQPDEIVRADAAIEQAGRGEIGGTVQWSAPSGARGTIRVEDEIYLPGQPVCRVFAIHADLPARTESRWQTQGGGGAFGTRTVETQSQITPAGRYNFSWTACRIGAGWIPR
jgi:hypothetical protein